MTSCLLCSAEVYYRDGCRNKYLTEFCSRYCFELSKQGLPISTQKLKVNCSMCGVIFELSYSRTNVRHSWICSKECRNKKDTIFGRRSRKKYAILMMIKLNGPLTATSIASKLSLSSPAYAQLSAPSISSILKTFISRGGVVKIKEKRHSLYKLVYDIPLELLAAPTLID